MTKYDVKKCYWSYDGLRQVATAYAGLMVDNHQVDMEQAKTSLKFMLGVLNICANDKISARKLQKMGKKAEEDALKEN